MGPDPGRRARREVLEEFYHVVTRKLSPSLPAAEAREELRELCAWNPVALTPAVIEGAWQVQDQSAISFWGAMIVAAAREADATTLLSEDLGHGQVFGGVRVLNPFAEVLPPPQEKTAPP